MFVERILFGPADVDVPLDGDVRALLERMIGGLKGDDVSTLLLFGPGAEHLAVGGDASDGLVVYCTSDNAEFFQLGREDSGDTTPMVVVAGGQPGEFDARFVVDASVALDVAETFALTGGRNPRFTWHVS